MELVCRCCGKTFTANYIAKVPYCSKECRKESRRQTCKECGKVYYHSSKSMCCSKECLDKYRNRISIEKRKRVCETCGKEFIMPYMSGKGKRGEAKEGRFCSKKCYGAWLSNPPKPPKLCKICGKETPSQRESYCSDECRREKNKRRAVQYGKANKILKARLCKECGKKFTPEYGDKRRSFCSKFCSRKYLIKTKYKDARKRARALGVYYEYVNPLKVFKRDGWRCQLCGKKLSPKQRGTYCDDAPELDHIIPWAQGGEHSYKNTQLACRKCNAEKGAQSIGQMLLFG